MCQAAIVFLLCCVVGWGALLMLNDLPPNSIFCQQMANLLKCIVAGFICVNSNNQLKHLDWEVIQTFNVLNQAHKQESSVALVTAMKVIHFCPCCSLRLMQQLMHSNTFSFCDKCREKTWTVCFISHFDCMD